MHKYVPLAGAFAALVTLSACGPKPGTLEGATAALGAAKTESITIAGNGKWYWFGQQIGPTEAWPPFELTKFNANISFAAPAARIEMARKAAADSTRGRGEVVQTADQYVEGAYAWNVNPAPAGGTPTTVAQPGAVTERLIEVWSTTPQGFLKAAQTNKAEVKPAGGGSEVSITLGASKFTGTINDKNEVTRIVTTLDNPVLGDMSYETAFSDYKDFGGLKFPGHIVRTIAGNPALDVTVTEAKANAAQTAPTPDAAKVAAPPQKVEAQNLAPGVWYLTGGSHHNLLVEQKDQLVLVEAGLDETRSIAVLAKVAELVPNKPLKYVINTHSHFDHSGGLRTFVDAGATIVTHEANQPFYAKAWGQPHTLNPDKLAQSKKGPNFQTFTDKLVLEDPAHPVEVHLIAGNGHSAGFSMIYLPKEKILMEADAYTSTPTVPTAAPASPNPFLVNLVQNIERLKLDVATVTPIHGPRVVPLAELRLMAGL